MTTELAGTVNKLQIAQRSNPFPKPYSNLCCTNPLRFCLTLLEAGNMITPKNEPPAEQIAHLVFRKTSVVHVEKLAKFNQ
jgi:hypothetical protein